MRALLRGAAVIAASASLAAGSCKKREALRKAPPVMVVPARPAEVFAEAVVGHPDELWTRLRPLLGAPATLLASSPELALGTLLGFEPLTATSLDLRSPLKIALVNGPEAGFVLAVRVENGPELLAKLTTGNRPSYRLERRADVAELTRVEAGGAASLAVIGDTLVAGSAPLVARVAPYLGRSMPKGGALAPAPVTLTVFGSALELGAVPLLREAWQARRRELEKARDREQQQRGRPADLADPGAVLNAVDGAVKFVLSLLESTSEIRGELSLSDDRLESALEVVPTAHGAAEQVGHELSVGATEMLGLLPDNTAVALLLRRGAGERGSGAFRFASELLGPSLTPLDQRAVEQAMNGWEQGRGGAHAIGVLTDFGLVWRGDVSDPRQLRRALNDTAGLVVRRPFAEALSSLLGARPRLEHSTATGARGTIDKVVVRFSPPASSPGHAEPRRIELASTVSERRFVLALGHQQPAPLDQALAAEAGPTSLGESAAPRAVLARVPRAAALLFIDLALLGLGAGASSAPIALSIGERHGHPEITVVASALAVHALFTRELAR